MDYFSIPPQHISVIQNGIDADAIRSAAESIPPLQPPYLIACGRLSPEKNYDFLLAALAHTRRARELPLVILGAGSKEAALRKQAHDGNLRLMLPGFVDVTAPYIKHAQVFLHTSLYEGMPNVLLEAMALGTPVLAVNAPGGIAEIIQPGVTGLLSPCGDIDAFAAALDQLLADESLRVRLADDAQKMISRTFNLSTMLQRYHSAIEAVNT